MGLFNKPKKKKYLEDTEDIEQDLKYIMEFYARAPRDLVNLHKKSIEILKSRSSERSELDSKKQLVKLQNLIISWDKYLEEFLMYYRDSSLTGERIKRISKVLTEETEKVKVKKSLKDMAHKKDEWIFNW